MGLYVEGDELHGAAATITRSVSTPHALSGVTVAAAAADQVSATVAGVVSTRLAVISGYSTQAASITAAAAVRLHANASTYRDQEELNAAALGSTSAPAPSTTTAPAGVGLSLVAAVAPTGAAMPAGVTPTDGKSIAALIHCGPGPASLLAAADAARAHAAELRNVGNDIRSGRSQLARSWQSPAAQNAQTWLAMLERWYVDHAACAAATGRICAQQAEVFTSTRAATPHLEEFAELERRLIAARQANTASGGRYASVITALQTQLAALQSRAVTAYADYTTRAADLVADTAAAPPQTVQALDNSTIKEAPPGPLPKAPWEYNNGYTTTVHARGPDGTVVDGGSLVSLDDVWKELHRCFNCNFPIGGAPQAFPAVGDQLPLEMKVAGAQLANLPVQVTQIQRTADAIDIEFATLPGHEDGPGSTIHFRWTEQAGTPHLDIRGYITEGPGSDDGPFAAPERLGYTALAKMVWQPSIDNVVTHVVQAKGYEALPRYVVGGHPNEVMKRTLSMTGLIGLGILAAFGLYLVCVVATFLAGGWVYSIALGAQVAPLIAIAVIGYLWTRRRDTTSWPLIVAMAVTLFVLAALAFYDSPSLASVLFR
ncbi:PPE domain-containing protein [Mycobacterium sp. PSTR-4-N]|nr:PPE domain-containing protein [Mycobacterium sp. PSTR-4-N]